MAPKGTKTKKKATKKSTKAKEMAALRERLDTQRREILDMYEHDLKVGQSTSDEGAEDLVDRANSAYNREFMLSLSGSERQILLDIEGALARFDAGGYGKCVHCEEVITESRLQALPWARYCIKCQELEEQGLLYDG